MLNELSVTSGKNTKILGTSQPIDYLIPLVKAGIVIVAEYNPRESLMSNPRSANIVSPGKRFCRRLELSGGVYFTSFSRLLQCGS